MLTTDTDNKNENSKNHRHYKKISHMKMSRDNYWCV